MFKCLLNSQDTIHTDGRFYEIHTQIKIKLTIPVTACPSLPLGYRLHAYYLTYHFTDNFKS